METDPEGSQMTCRMPALSLPDYLLKDLETSDSGITDATGGYGVAVYFAAGVRVDVYVGLALDGFLLYNNISSIFPDVKMRFAFPPVLECQADYITFSPDEDDTIAIQVVILVLE